MDAFDLDLLDFAKGGGTVTVVAQDARTRAVLMVAHADREALEKTLETGLMHFKSRTRGLWKKGGTSGNVLRVERLIADCDADAVLAAVSPAGPACHMGTTTCFGEPEPDALAALERIIAERAASLEGSARDPAAKTSYTHKLLADRNLRLKKIGEEAAELVVALADRDRARAAEEAADVVYHTLVALAAEGVTWTDVRAALAARTR